MFLSITLQTNVDSFIKAGFQATFYVDSYSSDHSSTEFFASIAAVFVALVLIVILITLLVLCYWWVNKQKLSDQEDPLIIKTFFQYELKC